MTEPSGPFAHQGVDGKTAQLDGEVRRIKAICLVGVPQAVVLEETVVVTPEGEVPAAVLAKMSYLAAHENVRFVIVTDREAVPAALGSIPALEAWQSLPDAFNGDAIVIAATPQPIGEGIHAWHVGVGPTPEGMRPCRFKGIEGTDVILGLYGAGLMQERAGAAFRAASRGEEPPVECSYERDAILYGISVAVAPSGMDEEPPLTRSQVVEIDNDSNALVRRAFAAIKMSCASTGAIAATPPRRSIDDPDYWFFWQRDAGQVAVALTKPETSAIAPALAAEMEHVLREYVSFVTDFPGSIGDPVDLTISRFTVEGGPVVAYGSPQNDGPAHTALALLAGVGPSDAREALKLAKPYLDLLVRLAVGASTYDPWEFAVGRIFSTENLIRRALRHAHLLSVRIQDQVRADEYGRAAAQAERRLADFFDAEKAYIRAGRDFLNPWPSAMSGLDSGVIGSILVAYDVTDDFMNVDDPRVAQTMSALEGWFADRWPVNRRWKALGQRGLGFGRFPEDTNDGIGSTGGNPWVVTTLWAAQYYLRLIQRLVYRGAESANGYSKDQLLAEAEGIVCFVLTHVSPEAIAEQIDGQTGKPRGADRMSWAHAELINTLLIRDTVKATCF